MTFQAKDATGATVDFKSTDNAGVHTPHKNVEFNNVTPAVGEGAANTGSQRVVINNDSTVIGAVNEVAPVNDTASSGLNGRLQRIAQRLTSLIALLPAALGAGGGLKVDGSGTALPVSGTVATSNGALETGGNLAAAVTALQVIDDWDETDRAKVNPIVGQAGLQGGSGVVSANTLRAVLATDVPLPAGTNNIGDVDVLTQPARVRTTDAVSVGLQTDVIMNGLTALTPKFAIIDAATSGDNTLVAAVASKKIRVLSLYLISAGAVNVRFESGAGGTALSGQMNLVANTGFVLGFNPVGWFETAVNTLLNLELSGAISVDGGLQYVEV